MKPLSLLALSALAIPVTASMAQVLSPSPVSEATVTARARNGAPETIRVNVQAWTIAGQGHQTREIPLRGFYVAHLITGHILATIDGQTAHHLPGDYWTVKASGVMRVKVLGETAVLQTINVNKELIAGQNAEELGRILEGINLRGQDYRNIWLESAEPPICQQACRTDAACVAWTYVKPGVQGQKARCWLKKQTPPQTPDPCCISGIERF